MKLLKRIKNNNGTSIIEILVAMVIFVAGILYVVRMFPGGFSSIKQTENATIAGRLAQSEIERWKGRMENLPAGILAVDPFSDPNILDGMLVDQDPEDMRTLAGVPAGTERYYSDVNKFRHIVAESTKIPVPSPGVNTWQSGSVYILGFSPIVYTNVNSMMVYSSPMRRQSLPVDTRWLTWMTHRDYSIDYDNGVIYIRRADYDRQYLISYSYWDQTNTGSKLISVINKRITVTAKADTDPDPEAVKIMAPDPNNPGTDIWLRDIPTFAGVEQGTDKLQRMFMDITAQMDAGGNVPWNTDNPYEYVVKDSFAGVIAFNPLGYGYQELTTSGKEPLRAYLDYDVVDWHIIRDEKRVPSQPSSPEDDYINVRLSLDGILNKGHADNIDNTRYQGLTPDKQFSVVAVDSETGQTYTEESMADIIDVPAMKVDYKNGVIAFHKSFADRTFRIFYQANDYWAVQVYKAFSIYNRRYDVPAEPKYFGHDYYYLGDNGRIYFPRCYAGTTVAVNYSYRVNGNPPEKFINGEAYKISQDVDGTTGLCYIDISKKLADRGVTGASISQVSKVYGVTLGVRVIWRTSGKGLSSFWRWRKVDMQTYLTRPNI